MAKTVERKIPVNVAFTPRQSGALEKEAKRRGVAVAELLRGILDEWLERRPTLATKLYGDRLPS